VLIFFYEQGKEQKENYNHEDKWNKKMVMGYKKIVKNNL
jgi:hypothetical protein